MLNLHDDLARRLARGAVNPALRSALIQTGNTWLTWGFYLPRRYTSIKHR